MLHGQCYLLPAPEYLGLAAEGLPNNKQDAPAVQYPVWLFRSKKSLFLLDRLNSGKCYSYCTRLL